MGLTKNLGWLSKYITADSTGKIGIGTATPNYGLNVVSSDITLSGIVSNRFIGIRKTSNTLPGYLGLLGGDNGDNAKIIGYNSAGTQTFEINASTSATYFNGGNVGIGTPSPISVSGHTSLTVNSSATPRIDLTVGNSQRGLIAALDSRFLIYSQSAIPLILGTNDTERMHIFPSGNVFIGPSATDAGFRLDVNGTGRFVNELQGLRFFAIGSLNNSNGSFLIDHPGIQTWKIGVTNSNTSTFSIGNDNGGAFAAKYFNITNAGNVGIGNDNPAEKLSVNASTSTWGSIIRNNSKSLVALSHGLGYGMAIDSVSNAWSTYLFKVAGGDGTNMGTVEYFKITGSGALYSVPTYSNTSGSGANLGIASDGFFYRSTSSLKYKKNVENYEKGLNEIMQMRPVTYNSINESEEGIQYAGLIAEEIHELGLTEFVQYAEDGTPDALAYSNMVALLVKAIQELTERIKTLENK